MPGFDKNSTFIPPTYNATSSAVVFTVGVSGNIIALALLLSARRATKRTAFYALVFGLTLTDLLGSSLTGPVPLTAYAHNKTVVALGGHALCGYLSFMLLFFGVATLAILCAMAIERYLSIGHPYLYERVVRRASAWTAIRVSYLLSLALCLPPLLGFGQVKLYEPGTWCYVDMKASGGWDAAYSVLYAAILAALCLTIIVCNASVMHGLLKMMNRKRKRSLHAAPACGNAAPRFLKQQQQNHQQHQQQQNENEEDGSHQVGRHVAVAARVSSSRRRILRGEEANNLVLLVLITITSLTCTIPLTIRAFINASGAPANEALDLLGLRMYTITPILDPWIYIFCRKSLCRRLCGRWAGSRGSRGSRSSGGGGVGRGSGLGGDAARRRRLSGFEPDQETTDAAPSVVAAAAADRSPCSTSSLGPRGERQQQQQQQQPLVNGRAPKAPEGPATAPTVTPSGGAAAVAAAGGAACPNAATAVTASLSRRHCLSDRRRDDDSYDDGDDEGDDGDDGIVDDDDDEHGMGRGDSGDELATVVAIVEAEESRRVPALTT